MDHELANRGLPLLFALCLQPAVAQAVRHATAADVLPRPLQVERRDEAFVVEPAAKGQSARIGMVCYGAGDAILQPVAALLQRWLVEEHGASPVPVFQLDARFAQPRCVVLTRSNADPALGDEGYELTVDASGIVIRAPEVTGLLRGARTLVQMLPPKPAPGDTGDGAFQVDGVRIVDRPRFAWRGMHLDVGRHFMPVDFVKKYLDVMARYKLNVFHWHLTEDQGWRIEIKQHPELTSVGAWRTEDGKKTGGFYTQEEIKEVVAHAASLGITVVPEIEMPGHCKAALAACPELACTGGPFTVPATWGIFDDVFCAGNDATFRFLEEVLTEVVALFPGTFVHIGGDECPGSRWKECAKCQARIKSEHLKDDRELHGWFVRRISRFLAAKEKRLVGWDEIMEGGLGRGDTVMSWRGADPGTKAARLGHDVVMSPTSHCYFDYRQSAAEGEPGVGPVTTLRHVYSYEPVPRDLTAKEASHILGVQGNVWTEWLPTQEQVWYMALPRMCALAEVAWSSPERRDWDDFARRIETQIPRLQRLALPWCVPAPEGIRPRTAFIDEAWVALRSPLPGAAIRYTLDGSEPGPASLLFKEPFALVRSAVLRARTFPSQGGPPSRTVRAVFENKTPLEPVRTRALAPGVAFRCFAGTFHSVAELAGRTALKTGTIDRLAIPAGLPAEDFGVELRGFLEVPADGIYTFSVVADDGATLHVGETLVVDNDGVHARKEADGLVALKAGRHPIRVSYFQGKEVARLEVSWAGPGIAKREVPAAALSHRE